MKKYFIAAMLSVFLSISVGVSSAQVAVDTDGFHTALQVLYDRGELTEDKYREALQYFLQGDADGDFHFEYMQMLGESSVFSKLASYDPFTSTDADALDILRGLLSAAIAHPDALFEPSQEIKSLQKQIQHFEGKDKKKDKEFENDPELREQFPDPNEENYQDCNWVPAHTGVEGLWPFWQTKWASWTCCTHEEACTMDKDKGYIKVLTMVKLKYGHPIYIVRHKKHQCCLEEAL